MENLDTVNQSEYAEPQKLINTISLLHGYTTLAIEINKRRRNKYDQLEAIIRFFFAHVYQLGSSAYQLCRLGYGTPSLILARSIFEALVDSSYLWLCKRINGSDEERDAWAEQYSVSRVSMKNFWGSFEDHLSKKGGNVREKYFESKPFKKFEDKYEEFKAKYGRTFWAKAGALDKRARAVDDTRRLREEFSWLFLEEEYLVYKMTSEVTHGEVSTVSSYVDGVGDTLILGESQNNIEVSLGMTNNYMLIFGWIYSTINHIDPKLLLNDIEKNGFKV